MKSYLLSFSFLLFTILGFATGVEPITKSINVATSNIVWKASKVTGTHEGNIKFKSGTLKFDGEMLIGGELYEFHRLYRPARRW